MPANTLVHAVPGNPSLPISSGSAPRCPPPSRITRPRQRQAGFVGGEFLDRLMLLAGGALYIAVTLPLAGRLSEKWPGALWLPLIPPALCYLGGSVAALISPYDSPRFKESFFQRTLYFGNLAFISVAFASALILVLGLVLYHAVRWLKDLL